MYLILEPRVNCKWNKHWCEITEEKHERQKRLVMGKWIHIHRKFVAFHRIIRISPEFYIVICEFPFSPQSRDLVISSEIALKLISFSLKITKNGENCQSRISRFTKMVRSKIMFMLSNDSQNILKNFWDTFSLYE